MIASVSAVQFDDLSDGDVLNSSPDITVSDVSGADNVTLEIVDYDSYTIDVSSSSATFTDINVGSNSYGTYDVEVYENDDQSTSVSRSNIVFDGETPSINSESPGVDEFVGEDNPDIEASFDDSNSNLENASISFEGEIDEATGIGSSSQDLSIDGNDYDALDDGEHTVDYEAYDEAGNSIDSSWDFTVDTEYDGDSNPDFWVEKDGDEVEDDYFDFEDDVELVADFGDADSESDTTVSCMIEGEEIDTFTVSAGDDDPSESDTTCDIDYDEDEPYYDTNAEIYLEMEDQAGNTEESDTQELGFDASAPTFAEFEAGSGIAVFNSDFEMSYETLDTVSGVDYIDYSVGDGDEVQLDESSGSFTVDTSGLEQGTFDVTAQAVDNVGKVSDQSSFEFDFYPDEVPEMSLDGETQLNVTSGSEETLELELSNTGRLLVPGGEVTGSVDFVEASSYGDLAPSESETLDVVFSPENGIGDYNVNLEASSVNASHQVEVLVRADEERQSEIDSSISEFRTQFDDLNSRADGLRPSLNEDRTSRLNEDVEAFESQLNEAETAVEDGRYYDADEVLSDLNSSSQTAESTFETVRQEHETAMRNRYIIAGLFFVLLLIGGGAGFILYSEDYEIDIDSLKEIDIGSSDEESTETDDGYSHSESEKEEKSALDRIRDRVDNLRGSGEEEPEYEFK